MQKVSYFPLEKLPRLVVRGNVDSRDSIAPVEVRLIHDGVEIVCEAAPFSRLAARLPRKGGWESALGVPLAVSVLVHAEGKALVLRRRTELVVQSGKHTASVTGTVRGSDAAPDALALAALRELSEEVGLTEKDGTLSFRGLALAPGKLQLAALFEFAFSGGAATLLKRVVSHPEFGREHTKAEVLFPEEAFARPLSSVSYFAVKLFLSGAESRSPARTVSIARRLRVAIVASSALAAVCGAASAVTLSASFGVLSAACCVPAFGLALGTACLFTRGLSDLGRKLAEHLKHIGGEGGLDLLDPRELPFTELQPFVRQFNALILRTRSAQEREKDALLQMATTDGMTGLFNHREFHRRLSEVVCRGEEVAVACFDLNEVKQVNDRHGHAAGDEVIQLFASVLSDAASRVPGAVPARLGGDEFAALLPGVDREGAERFAKNVAADSRLEEGAARYASGRVSVGWGAAAYPGDVNDAGMLLARADERMYACKSNGRNFSAKLTSVLSRLDGGTTMEEAEAVFEALLGLIDGLDPGLAAHSRRVAELARSVAREMGLSRREVRLAEVAGKFHDIGKLSVGPSVLRKKGPLTEEERRLIERHPVLGADMLSAVDSMREVALIVRRHHERWDGTGYPDGLKGEHIPLLARIIAACEVYDAMTKAGFPRKGYAPEVALGEMRTSCGFDPAVLDALGKVAGRNSAGGVALLRRA